MTVGEAVVVTNNTDSRYDVNIGRRGVIIQENALVRDLYLVDFGKHNGYYWNYELAHDHISDFCNLIDTYYGI